jgi:spore coat protein U-like protein
MSTINRLRPFLLVFMLACAAPAFAQTASTTFDVTITITSTCSIDTPAATDVAFGPHASTETNVDAIGQLNVNCTLGTPYDIALNEGLNGADVASRAMSDGTNEVPYQLFQDAGRTTVWGETIGTDTFAGTGSGAVQAIPVYGRVPSTNFPAASYTDTVTATITY